MQTTEVRRGNLITGVIADGRLDMPHEVKLKFGAPGTVKWIFVEKGNKVKTGMLLAKLDDTDQKLTLASAQYDLELAINELIQKVYPPLLGYPTYYPDRNALLYTEQAQIEVKQAQQMLAQGSYKEAVFQLRLAQHDLKASLDMLNLPIIKTISEEYNDSGELIQSRPNIPKAIDSLEQTQKMLPEIQTLVEKGDYARASDRIDAVKINLEETYLLVKSFCDQSRRFQITFPDTSTGLSWLQQVKENLQAMQKTAEEKSYDGAELAEILRLAQHELEMSQRIFSDSELIFPHGLNLKLLRQNNINMEKAKKALQGAKETLMKTEILAPFDGTVVDIPVKVDDQLSAYDYSSKTAVHLVDTSLVRLEGQVDEIDIYKVKVGQQVTIKVDALPGEEFKGEVIFISPFGIQQSGVVNFPVSINIYPPHNLKGNLTATATIIMEKRENVLLVHNQAIKGTAGNYYVEVLVDEKTGKTEKRQVTVGAQNDRLSEITSGLKEGEKVLSQATK